METMSSLNDSIIIIKHFCYKCQKAVDLLSGNKTCGLCGTGFIEEILNTPSKSGQIKEEVENEINPSEPSEASQISESPQKSECCICLQEMDSITENVVNLICEHSFHKSCLKNWLLRANNCPLCRSKVDVPSIVTPAQPTRRNQLARRGQRQPTRVRNVNRGQRSRSPLTSSPVNISRPRLPVNGRVLGDRQFRNMLGDQEFQDRFLLGRRYSGLIISPTEGQSNRGSPEFAWVFPPEVDSTDSSD